MFGIGPLELVVIAIVAILFIGPDKLPDTMKKFGRFFVQARRHANDVKDTFHQVIHDAEREIEVERIREIQAKIQSTSPAQLLDAEIQKANTVSHEDDHAPYGTESYDQPHDHSDNPDFVSMDHFAKTPDPIPGQTQGVSSNVAKVSSAEPVKTPSADDQATRLNIATSPAIPSASPASSITTTEPATHVSAPDEQKPKPVV